MSFLRRKKSKPAKKKKDASPSKVQLRTKSSKVSELNVESNQFYILVKKQKVDVEKQGDDVEDQENDKEVTIYADVKAPIVRIREYLKSDVDVDKIELMLVKIMEETLEVESVPWSKIAVELID